MRAFANNLFRRSRRTIVPDPVLVTLYEASVNGDLDELDQLRHLLRHEFQGGISCMHIAATQGHLHLVKWLHARGVPLHINTWSGAGPLHLAAMAGHIDIVQYLVDAGQPIDACTKAGATPLLCAAGCSSTLHMVKWLRRHGASPSATMKNEANVPITPLSGASPECRPWLELTRECCTLLHFALVDENDALVEDLSWAGFPMRIPAGVEARVRFLLRAGADVHARAHPDAASPLDIAIGIASRGGADHSTAARLRAADLVIAAAEPWSAANHTLFPAGARALAAVLVRIGHQLRNQRDEMRGHEQAFSDIWEAHVMPHAIERKSVLGARVLHGARRFDADGDARYSC